MRKEFVVFLVNNERVDFEQSHFCSSNQIILSLKCLRLSYIMMKNNDTINNELIETYENYFYLAANVFYRWEETKIKIWFPSLSLLRRKKNKKWIQTNFLFFFCLTFVLLKIHRKWEKGMLIKTSHWMRVRKFICMNNSCSCVCVPCSRRLLVPHWLIFRSCSNAHFSIQMQWMGLLRIYEHTSELTMI